MPKVLDDYKEGIIHINELSTGQKADSGSEMTGMPPVSRGQTHIL